MYDFLQSTRGAAVCCDSVHSFAIGGTRGDALSLIQFSHRLEQWKFCLADHPQLTHAAAAVCANKIVICGGIQAPSREPFCSLMLLPLEASWPAGGTIKATLSSCTLPSMKQHAICGDGSHFVFIHSGKDLLLYNIETDLIKGPYEAPSTTSSALCFAEAKLFVLDASAPRLHWCPLGNLGKGPWQALDITTFPSSLNVVFLALFQDQHAGVLKFHAIHRDGESKVFLTSGSAAGPCTTDEWEYGSWEVGVLSSRVNFVLTAKQGSQLIINTKHGVFRIDSSTKLLQPLHASVAKAALSPAPPSPVKVTPVIAPPAALSRMLLRVAADDPQARRCSVNYRRALHGSRDASPPREGASSTTTVSINAVHPHDSQVTISALAVPVNVDLLCTYDTDADVTTIRLEWVDVDRLVKVTMEQRVRIALDRKRQLEEQKSELAVLRGETQELRAGIEHDREVLEQQIREVNARWEELEAFRRHQDVRSSKLDDERNEIDRQWESLRGAQREFERRAADRDAEEVESEKRMRAERDTHRKIERELEVERKKDERAREHLQRTIDAQQNIERQLQRELDRIEREREQHKRETEWAKEKEELWAQERAAHEKKQSTLSAELEAAAKGNSTLTFQVREAQLRIAELDAEIMRQISEIQKHEGKRRDESDAEWGSRRDVEKRCLEQCVRGRLAGTGITIETNTHTNMVAIVDGGERECPLVPRATVSCNDTALDHSFIHLEVGDGFTIGDSLTFRPIEGFELRGSGDCANGMRTLHHVQTGKDLCLVPPTGLSARALCLNIVGGNDVRTAVEGALRCCGFACTCTSAAYQGVRSIEVMVCIEGKKHNITCSGTLFASVMSAPLRAFRDAAPFVERSSPLSIFGHFKVLNPFAELVAVSDFSAATSAFLALGLNGPPSATDRAERSDPRLVSNYVSRFGGLVERRRGWHHFPLQVDEKGVYDHAKITVRLERAQAEDEMFFDASDEVNSVLGSDVTVSTCGAEDGSSSTIIISATSSCTRQQLTAAIHAIHFRSTAVPLDEAERKVVMHVTLPSLRIPLSYTVSRGVQIVNASHEVRVLLPETSRNYRLNATSVNGVTFEPPALWFLQDVSVEDPMKSRFGGKVSAEIVEAQASHDKLGIVVHPSVSSELIFDEKSGAATFREEVIAHLTFHDDGTRVEIDFSRRTRSDSAASLLKCLVFSTSDTRLGSSRAISVRSALGRDHVINFLVTVQLVSPVVQIVKLGGIKWTEHQGPVRAAVQCIAAQSSESDAACLPVSLHVLILHGREDGDHLDLDDHGSAAESDINPSATITSCGKPLVSMIGRVRQWQPASLEVTIDVHNLIDGSLFVTIPSSSTTVEVVRGCIAAVLGAITYVHKTPNPHVLKKVLCIRAEDALGGWSDTTLPLSLVPVDDPTEIHDLHQEVAYLQGSQCASDGFSLACTARLHDPDTEDFIGGFISIEPLGEGSVSARDTLHILPLDVQWRNSDYAVYVDEQMRLFAFESKEEFAQYEEHLSKLIIHSRHEDEVAVTNFCIGSLMLHPAEDGCSDLGATTTPELARSRTATSLSGIDSVSVAPCCGCASPMKWEVRFDPPVSRLISLAKVQAALRGFGFTNTSPSAGGSRRFLVKLGAGSLASYASDIEGAVVADHTEREIILHVIPPLLFTPNFVATCSAVTTGVGVRAHPFKQITVPVPTSMYRIGDAVLDVVISSASRDGERILLLLKKTAGEAQLELSGEKVISLPSKQVVASLQTERRRIEVQLKKDVDTKILQTLVRSITYECDEVKSTDTVIVLSVRNCVQASGTTYLPPDSHPQVRGIVKAPQQEPPPSPILQLPSSAVEHVLRSGPTPMFPGVGVMEQAHIAMLRPPFAVQIVLPHGCPPLVFAEDPQLSTRPPTNAELLASELRGVVTKPPISGSPKKDSKGFALSTIIFGKHPFALFATLHLAGKGVIHRIECIAAPPTLLALVLDRLSYSPGSKDKVGMKHTIRVSLSNGNSSWDYAIVVQIKPPYIEEIADGSSLPYTGKMISPFASVKVRLPQLLLAGGGVIFELIHLASEQEAQIADHIVTQSSDDFRFEFTTEETGVVIACSGSYTTAAIADVVLTPSTLSISFFESNKIAADLVAALDSDALASFLRMCMGVARRSSEDGGGDVSVSLVAKMTITSANGAQCSSMIQLAGQPTLARKKSSKVRRV